MVEVPVPPVRASQAGSGSHMARTLADVALAIAPPCRTDHQRGEHDQHHLRARWNVSAGTFGTWEYGDRPPTQPGRSSSSASGPSRKNTTTSTHPAIAQVLRTAMAT